MKEFRLLLWLTQLGLDLAVPLAGGIFLGVRLRQCFGLGPWAVAAGLVLGIAGGLGNLRSGLRTLERLARESEHTPRPPEGGL